MTPVNKKTSNVVESSTIKTNSFIQLKITDEHNPSAENKLTMAIADFIHSLGLPFSIAPDSVYNHCRHN